MKVAVCCKGVPIEMTAEIVNVVDGDIQYTGTDFYINEFDAYALEAALNLKKEYGAETIALSLGPLRTQEVLHFAQAKGIDKVMRIDGESGRPELIAGGLVPALEEIDPQLILVGVQSEDWMGGEVGIYLGRALDASVAYAVKEIVELTDSHVRVKKELGGGKMAEVLLTLPAVLCVQSGIQRLQYVSAGRLRKARALPITSGGRLDSKDVKNRIPGMTAYEITEASEPSREGRAEMVTGDRSEKAAKLLEIFRKIV